MSGIEAYDLGKEDGAAEERERIIKLLEDTDSVSGAWAIALINGENK